MVEIIAVCFGIITLTAVLLSCYALHNANEARIEVEAMKRSTHQVQFVPVDPNAPDDDKNVEKVLSKEDEKAWQELGEFASGPLS